MLDRLRRRAKRNNWAQKFIVILLVLMMVLTGFAYVAQSLF